MKTLESLKAELIDFFQSQRVSLSQFELNFLFSFLKKTQNIELLELLIFNLAKSQKTFFNFTEINLCLESALNILAQKSAKNAAIKKWKGSIYEENYLLREFFKAILKEENEISWI